MTEEKDPFKDLAGIADSFDDLLRRGHKFPAAEEPKNELPNPDVLTSIGLEYLDHAFPHRMPTFAEIVDRRVLARRVKQDFEDRRHRELALAPPLETRKAWETLTLEFLSKIAREQETIKGKAYAEANEKDKKAADIEADRWKKISQAIQDASELRD